MLIVNASVASVSSTPVLTTRARSEKLRPLGRGGDRVNEADLALFDGWCEVSPIGDLLVRGSQLHPDRDLIVFPEARHSYADTLERTCHVARGLHALGIGHRDHVGLLAPNGIEYIEAFFAIALLGAVAVPLHARHKAAELSYITANADLAAILTTSGANAY